MEVTTYYNFVVYERMGDYDAQEQEVYRGGDQDEALQTLAKSPAYRFLALEEARRQTTISGGKQHG